ncbi:putative duf1857 domain-containing protein [Rosellinia necatrix]|uniref:Putative duf1857 domain-containing protein n=1 Tax=Rosellinia necatrix TaxID=77044 RepID=A0A1W2TU78_ROSNE|nr:putative duf1857 domain-containing protein [Rosellinia necatrix]
MVTFNVAYTSAINKAGATPTLTQAQVWEGLKMKVRRAQDFVSAITECQVLSEETLPTGDLQVTREVRFVSTAGLGGGAIKEVCVHYEPCRIVFNQEDGSTVTNIISKRPDGELLMSYVFEWRHPDVPEGSEKAAQLEEAHWKMAKTAVESSIDTIRRFVNEGKIQ